MQGLSELNRELLDASALCRQLVPKESVEAFLADHRHELFPDEMFEDLFVSKRGRPSIPADIVASVMVLQALEGLSDRDAARALTDRISWKVACGLALDEEGFDYSVLTYWRTRLRNSDRPERIFEAVRQVIEATGVLKGKTRRALDSTLLDDAVATQDTVTQLVAAIRRVRRVVPIAREVSLVAHDYDAAGKPLIAWDDEVARGELVNALVNDALRLLDACADVDEPESAAALGLLALVAGQDVELDDQGRWCIVHGVAKDRVISVVDPEARHMRKSRSEYRDGYKAHLCVEPETGLITAAALTPASAPDGPTGVRLLEGEVPGLQVLADGAYGSGETLAALKTRRVTTRRSSPSPHTSESREAFTATTSSSTTRRAPRPARPVTSSHSRRRTTPSSATVARAVPCVIAAPPQSRVASCTSLPTTRNASSPGAPGATVTSFRTIENIDPWSNDRSRGS